MTRDRYARPLSEEEKSDQKSPNIVAHAAAEAERDKQPPQERPAVIPAHDKAMASRFLAGLDPNATKFTFQLFGDGAGRCAEIFYGTLEEVWPKVLASNTPQRSAGVFVTIGETDFKGRKVENIVPPRALFADADSKEQAERCVSVLTACGVYPSMAVNSGRGYHFYFCTDVLRDQFSMLQRQLIAKLGTDPAVKDLSRVMRLPGTLHLKDPANPRLVKLINPPPDRPVERWQLPNLESRLGLSSSAAAPKSNVVEFKLPEWVLNSRPAAAFAYLSPLDESLTEGLDANIDEIRSAVMAIPLHVISVEAEWMRLACGLAFEGRVFKKRKGDVGNTRRRVATRGQLQQGRKPPTLSEVHEGRCGSGRPNYDWHSLPDGRRSRVAGMVSVDDTRRVATGYLVRR